MINTWWMSEEQIQAFADYYAGRNTDTEASLPSIPTGGEGTPQPKKHKCIVCHRRVGLKTGAILLIGGVNYLHIKCFAKKIDELEEQGKLEEIQSK